MFKIHDDKVYFVAETPNINKVIEIFLPKDDRGTIMDSHEIRVDLCRAIRKLQHDGYTIMKVYPAMGDRRESIDVLSMPEFIQSAKCPDNDVEEAVIFSYFESGATFQLPCKVNKETHEIFDVTCAAMPCDDDCFSYAEVEINGKDYPVNFIDDILSENNADDALDEFYRIQQTGEYFLFLNHLTCSMASPLNNRCFYGANTTNEWVVREYIKDKENNPTIYNGLPLHTEYRVFVDFDTKEILGASPYWRSDVMKNEFKKVSRPQERHDYVVYKMHEDILNQRYHESVQTVLAELKKVISRIELTGQWSVDVMRNGNDYYIIDMALAENSALNDCVPKNLLRAYPQQWLPGESNS